MSCFHVQILGVVMERIAKEVSIFRVYILHSKMYHLEIGTVPHVLGREWNLVYIQSLKV